MAFSNELLDQLLAGCERPEDILGPRASLPKKALAERALGAELSHHLAREAHAASPIGRRRNHRNGSSAKTVLTETEAVATPSDRAGRRREWKAAMNQFSILYPLHPDR